MLNHSFSSRIGFQMTDVQMSGVRRRALMQTIAFEKLKETTNCNIPSTEDRK